MLYAFRKSWGYFACCIEEIDNVFSLSPRFFWGIFLWRCTMCDSTVCIVQKNGKQFIADAREYLELKEKGGTDIGESNTNSLDSDKEVHDE